MHALADIMRYRSIIWHIAYNILSYSMLYVIINMDNANT